MTSEDGGRENHGKQMAANGKPMGSGLLAEWLPVSFVLDVTLAKDLKVRELPGNWGCFLRYKDRLRPRVGGEPPGWKSEQGRAWARGQN